MKNFIDKLAFIELRDKKILVTLSRGKDAWYIPGGKREGNETDHEALIREVKEELTVDIIPSTIVYFGTFEAKAHGKPEGTIVRMTCFTARYKGKVVPSSEIERVLFVDSTTTEPLSPVDYLIFADLKKKGLIN